MKNSSRMGGIIGVCLFLSACNPQSSLQPTPVPQDLSALPASAPKYPSTGPDVVAFVMQRYPERLAAGVSLSDRVANMEFLRDKIIELGICGGMDIGWNMKRGGPEKSKDFVAWFDGRHYMGVDIARGYDATNRPLQLQWSLYRPTPHYREYQPRPRCK